MNDKFPEFRDKPEDVYILVSDLDEIIDPPALLSTVSAVHSARSVPAPPSSSPPWPHAVFCLTWHLYTFDWLVLPFFTRSSPPPLSKVEDSQLWGITSKEGACLTSLDRLEVPGHTATAARR